jgi:hypothetical protein
VRVEGGGWLFFGGVLREEKGNAPWSPDRLAPELVKKKKVVIIGNRRKVGERGDGEG